MLEYRCGVCDKLWSSWRSIIIHYSKSNCRHATSTTSPSSATITQISSNVISQNKTIVENTSTKPSTLDKVIDEKSETAEQIDGIRKAKKVLVDNIQKAETEQHSPSVIPKNNNHNDDYNTNITTSQHVDIVDTIDGEPNENLSIVNESADMNSKKTGIGNLYYCKLCASGGWEKQVSLSQYMRHMHKVEYNASIEVPLKRKRWTRDDMIILAELELSLSMSERANTNSSLATKFPSRSYEVIKSRRKTTEYKNLLRHVRESQTTESIEGSDDSETSCTLDEDTTVNGSICNRNNIINNSRNHSLNDSQRNTQRGTDNITYSDIREYIKNNIIDGRVQICSTMHDALLHYVDDVFNSDPVCESLNGIREANCWKQTEEHSIIDESPKVCALPTFI